MRRIDYAARKDAINAQKRAAYTLRTGSNSVPSVLKPFTVADCSVSTESYSFPDGYGGTMKTEDATVYTAPDNTKFVFPKKYDKSHQTMTPEQAVACWNKVPEGIRKQAQKEIVFADYYNPADTYWQKVYKNFPHSYRSTKKRLTLSCKAFFGAPSVGALRIQSCGLNLATSPRETNTSACAKCESVPKGMVQQKSRNICCGFFWCTIGDSPAL